MLLRPVEPPASKPDALAPACAALLVLSLVAVCDRWVLEILWLREGPAVPGFDLFAHSAAWLLAAALGVCALLRTADVAGPVPMLGLDDLPLRRACRTIGAAGLALALLLVASPSRFAAWSVEDGPIETLSALLGLLAATTAVGVAWRMHRDALCGAAGRMGLLLVGAVCFVLAGEEVSWLQRVFDWSADGVLSRLNSQSETNLHNLATNLAENLYYVGVGFGLFVLMPALRDLGALRSHPALARAARFVPASGFIGVGALISACNYDMVWGAPTQFAFWFSMLLLGWLALRSTTQPTRHAAAGWLVLAATVQALLLLHGGDSPRLASVTEYKELLLPSALLAWTLQLWRATTRAPAASERQA